jgi:hypothetical protein
MDARLRTSGMTITHLFSCSFVSQELISIPAPVFTRVNSGGNDDWVRTYDEKEF